MALNDASRFDSWTSTPGLYSIHHVDTGYVLDHEHSDKKIISCCGGDPMLSITNPNQLWQLMMVSKDKWILVNKRSGEYLSAPDVECTVVPQVGHPDWTSAHWEVVPAKEGSLWALKFLSVRCFGSVLEFTKDGILKVGSAEDEAACQTWYIKRQS